MKRSDRRTVRAGSTRARFILDLVESASIWAGAGPGGGWSRIRRCSDETQTITPQAAFGSAVGREQAGLSIHSTPCRVAKRGGGGWGEEEATCLRGADLCPIFPELQNMELTARGSLDGSYSERQRTAHVMQRNRGEGNEADDEMKLMEATTVRMAEHDDVSLYFACFNGENSCHWL